ncbi:MAG TPA: FkbM family methyltransferase [Pirellulales bacterium]|jgi:FkbM family methyltransferase|nr:FkbM family methyltransferase [Pirellulales bacterium]
MSFTTSVAKRLGRFLHLNTNRIEGQDGIAALESTSRKPFDVESTRRQVDEILGKSDMDRLFRCQINGLATVAPASVLRLYPHCLHPAPVQHLTYDVEGAQSRWLCSKLNPGDAAFDVGAACGLLSLAMSRAVGNTGRVYSFEPSREAFRTLRLLVTQNALTNVETVPMAVGGAVGTTEFIEFKASRDFTWAPDTSTIATAVVPQHPHERYEVAVTTIDSFCSAHGTSPRAMKIDIEGFELDALQGGRATIERCRPYLCIDIHVDPRTKESTRGAVERYLTEVRYQSNMQAHALYAEPTN